MTEENDNEPFDDVTNWVGFLPKTSRDNPKHTTERDTRRKDKPDVQRKELPETARQQDKPSQAD
jgi:acetyl-CoA carboxylase carboxyltransferase component